MGIPTWLLLIVVLIPTVCLIAYVSDNMGKQLGKKRVSVFGLRPRQTATLLTMASGTGIMLLTFGALFAVSKQVRNDLFRAAEIRKDNERLRTESRALAGQVEQIRSRIAASKNQAESAERRAKEAVDKAASAAAKTKAAQAQLTSAQTQLGNTRALLGKAQAQLASAKRGEEAAKRGEQQARVQTEQAQAQARQAQAQARQAQAQARQAQARFQEAQARVNEAQRRFAAAEQRVKGAENRARQADLAVGDKQRQLSAATKSLDAERVRLTAAQTDLKRAQTNVKRVQDNVKKVQAQMKTTIQEFTDASLKLASTQKEVNQLKQDVAFHKANLTALKSVAELALGSAELALGSRVKVNLGQVFAERIILPGRDASAMENEVRELLKSAQAIVGEAPFNAKTLALANRTIDTENGSAVLSGEQVIQVVVQYLTSQRTPVAVRLVAARNHIEGENELEGMLLPVAVRPAFTQGEILAESAISPSGGDARIFNALLQLVNAGERVARERGVTPPLTPASPNFFAAGTNERIFQALRQIAASKNAVTVRLIAAQDLTTVEPMRVQFQIVGDGS